jgi:glycosyltransferase involved in cell wall biosynthesis
MYRNHTVGVVVPAYNEAGLVGDVLADIPAYVDRVYAVDDASTDETWAEIEAHADGEPRIGRAAAVDDADAPVGPDAGDGGHADHEDEEGDVRTGESPPAASADGGSDARVVPIRHAENRGAGGAIKTGYLAARADRIDATVTIDADGQMDTDLLPRFLDPIVEDRADYAKGNRFLADTEQMPRFRLVGNRMLSLLTKIASGYWGVADPQNGYTAISLRALDAMDLEGMYEYYGYCNDVLVRLNRADMRVADVAQPAKYDEEESHIQYGEYVRKVSLMLLADFLGRLNRKHLLGDGPALPAVAYYAGAGAVALGLVRLAAALRPSDGGVRGAVGRVVLGVALLVVAMALDRRAHRELSTRDGG